MNTPSHPHLALYYFLTCPYCANVLDCIDKLNLKIEKRDIWKDEKHRQKLSNDTGRTTVPCLYIDDHPMFESSEIIDWLNENAGRLEKD